MNPLRKFVPKYSEQQIAAFCDINSFMDAYVELHKDSIESLYHIAFIKYFDDNNTAIKISKDDAVVAGNLVRLIKLNTSFLENTCHQKTEICLILNRCIAETYINLKFILINGEPNVKRNYIKNSLITEKELWETIKSNINERDDEALNIEKRMQKSISNSFENSDFEIDEVNRSSKWKSIKARADQLAGEQFYSIFYGISSHSIHGNWQDILINNLEKFEDGFKVRLDWAPARPQMMDSVIAFNADILKAYIEHELQDNPDLELLKYNCNILFDYERLLTNSHEKFLQQQNGL